MLQNMALQRHCQIVHGSRVSTNCLDILVWTRTCVDKLCSTLENAPTGYHKALNLRIRKYGHEALNLPFKNQYTHFSCVAFPRGPDKGIFHLGMGKSSLHSLAGCRTRGNSILGLFNLARRGLGTVSILIISKSQTCPPRAPHRKLAVRDPAHG